MREVPLANNAEALDFARSLVNGNVDMIIFLTGVGTRALFRVMETVYPRDEILGILCRRMQTVARGPKPAAALAEWSVPVTLQVPEPNTWHELLQALDDNKARLPLYGRRVAVQEYGTTNAELLAGLVSRGALVTRVPVYQWALPEDTAPLCSAIESLARGEIDIVLFTTSVQVAHLLQVAAEMKLETPLREALRRVVVGSIGPVTSQALREQGFTPDFEPEHPKMGFLLAAAAKRGASLLRRKREAKDV